MKFNCQYIQKCSGCSFKQESFDEQKNIKINLYKEHFLNHLSYQPEFKYFFPVEGYHRHRSDFILFEDQICLYDTEKRLLPIQQCSLLDPELQKLFHIISKTPFKLKGKGTIRLRVSPKGRWGVWLDFSNLEIKRLLEEETALKFLLQQSVYVEIGQKGKSLAVVQDQLKLIDPVPHPWFCTMLSGKSQDLYSLVSSFTQPSFKLNAQILEQIADFLFEEKAQFKNLIEFGCGVGNFSVFLSEYCQNLFLIENDPRNLIALQKNLESYFLKEKTTVIVSDKEYKNLPREENNLIFVNPPKSGVGKLFDTPFTERKVVYVSCYLDSMKKDLDKLFQQGFRLKKTVLFDQFPQSRHFETLSYLEK